MKKSLLALAALTAFAGAASAQSSVTLFGILDAGVTRISSGGKSVVGLTNSGYNSSRLGVRGVEDLGGGLQGGFWLEGQIFNDTGTGNGATAGWTWERRSTVSLMGGFGEIRLGRDYSTNFWNTTVYDPFGTNGLGTSNTFGMVGAAGNGVAAVRTNNSISYFTPPMGGASVQVQYAFGENLSGGSKANNYFGIRAGYAAGPISVHATYAKTEGGVVNGANNDGQDVKYFNVGASFNAGVVQPMLIVAQEKTGAGLKVLGIQPGIMVPVGAGTIRASYGRFDIKNSDNDWNKIAIGYLHNLSKRTTLYTTYARVSNKGTQTKNVGANGLVANPVTPGGSGSGFEFGVRHAF
jgi:predicted porin